jgi:hypothetical protein
LKLGTPFDLFADGDGENLFGEFSEFFFLGASVYFIFFGYVKQAAYFIIHVLNIWSF